MKHFVLVIIALALLVPGVPVFAQDAMDVTVRVTHGESGQPVADSPVILHAARPRGPFEPRAPKPQQEWAGFTDSGGEASFSVPEELATSGLKLTALTTYGGVPYESAAATPGRGVELEIAVYEVGLDVDSIVFENVRTLVELWEDYLVFSQFYTITNTGKSAFDTTALPGEDYEKGLPIVLPVKAQGINANGAGEMLVVNSTVYWNGTIEPGGKKNIQVRFSMPVEESEYVYEQKLDYAARNVEVMVPIQTRHTRVPRLDDLELRPKDFPETSRGPGIWGLRGDIEFVGARGRVVEAGDSFSFQLRGLPFHPPKLPWIFFGVAVVLGLIVSVVALRDRSRAESERGRETVLAALGSERDEILDELVALEKDYEEDHVTQGEYEIESRGLRERLALVLKKIEDLESET